MILPLERGKDRTHSPDCSEAVKSDFLEKTLCRQTWNTIFLCSLQGWQNIFNSHSFSGLKMSPSGFGSPEFYIGPVWLFARMAKSGSALSSEGIQQQTVLRDWRIQLFYISSTHGGQSKISLPKIWRLNEEAWSERYPTIYLTTSYDLIKLILSSYLGHSRAMCEYG